MKKRRVPDPDAGVDADAGLESFICPNCNILQGMDRVFNLSDKKGGYFCEDCGYDVEEYLRMLYCQD